MIYGDLVFVNTSNGQDESHVNIPSPRAPAIIAVDKKTGKEVGKVDIPARTNTAPMTYMLNGKQHITVSIAGAGYSGEIRTYKLGS